MREVTASACSAPPRICPITGAATSTSSCVSLAVVAAMAFGVPL